MTDDREILVSTEWLSAHRHDDALVVLDASAHLPGANRNARREFAIGHIPGARFLDLAGLKDENSAVPAALPAASQFGPRMRLLGVTSNDRIILYDDSDLRSAARAFFIFRMFGFRNIAILDGGLSHWRASGFPIEQDDDRNLRSDFADLVPDTHRVRTKSDILANIASGHAQIVDARDAGRFTGSTQDTVHGLPGGHIPGARNLHFTQLFQPDGTYKSPNDLRKAFDNAGIDLRRPIIASCGSGMTASTILFALELLGREGALYDGSWSEWGADPTTPKEQGQAA